MKIAVLYDSMFGNTKQVAEFLAEQLGSNGHEVMLFRTKQTKPAELLAFNPAAIFIGSPTHGKKPARTLKKHLKKMGELLEKNQSSDIKKAAVFNCYAGDIACEKIAEEVRKIIPTIELHDQSLPIQVHGIRGPPYENWKDLATNFLNGLKPFLF